MQRFRTLTAASALLILGVGSLTACGSDSSNEPQSAATSAQVAGPTSGIRSQAASPAPEESSEPAGQPTPERTTESAPEPTKESGAKSASASAPAGQETCGASGAEAAVSAHLADVPGVADPSSWTVEDSDGYDSCADLSWITLIGGGTGSSPRQQMLFHEGDYLGTTTSKPIGFHPATQRLTDSSIQVTYTYVKGNESNAEARGRAVSTYTWNPDTESIDHAGEWPPGIG